MSGPLPDEQLVAVGEAEEKAKKRHLELSDYIKSVHAGLRRKFKQCKNGILQNGFFMSEQNDHYMKL